MDEVLTASQVAALLKLHPRTVYKLVKQGIIPGNKLGRGWRFHKNEIVQLVGVPVLPTAKSDATEER